MAAAQHIFTEFGAPTKRKTLKELFKNQVHAPVQEYSQQLAGL